MKKEKSYKWYVRVISAAVVAFIILILPIIIMNLHEDCFVSEPVCYKTECTVWGCSQIEVDYDSNACEVKTTKCVSGTYGFN